uniref:PRKCSH domain-containing protein n=1 Tax=Angiostrongylus cantonensis TaxID=6313 RepID=A0A0K0D033_ANGCA
MTWKKSRLYEPDISNILSGIDPSFNLSTISSKNKQSILEKIFSDLPPDDDEGYVFVKSKTGQSFACKLPVSEITEKPQPTSYNPKYLAELITASFYINNCISKDNGWWKYKLCRGVNVKQWHGAKNEAQQVSNSLGIFLGKYSIAPYEFSTQDRLMYLEEHYEGGTLCDLHDKKSARKTAVRYECDPQLSTSEAYIDHVEEVVSCEYVITVKVGSLCSLSAFMPPNLVSFFFVIYLAVVMHVLTLLPVFIRRRISIDIRNIFMLRISCMIFSTSDKYSAFFVLSFFR